jgi:nucleoid DNA-binding protein
MKIDSCISELLYRHDCVIVTGLGGFVAQYRPASINPALHVLSPPSKRIAFNAFLQMNDGLLANHISRKLSLDYNAACQLISSFSGDTITTMKAGQKVKIDQVGTLYFDHEQNIQFTPDQHANFLVASFGMAPVHAPVIRREEQKYAAQVKPEPKQPEPVLVEVRAAGRRRRSGWKIMEVIPAAAVITFLLISPPALHRVNDHLSTLLPFSRMQEYVEEWKGTGEPVYKTAHSPVTPLKNIFEIPPANPAKAARLAPEGSSQTFIPSSGPATGSNQPDLPALQNQPDGSADAIPAAKETTVSSSPVSAANTGAAYHIIGGCFRSEENARKFVDQMESAGLSAAMIGRNKAGLIMVSVFASDSEAQAGDALEQIRTEHIPQAWLHQSVKQNP